MTSSQTGQTQDNGSNAPFTTSAGHKAAQPRLCLRQGELLIALKVLSLSLYAGVQKKITEKITNRIVTMVVSSSEKDHLDKK